MNDYVGIAAVLLVSLCAVSPLTVEIQPTAKPLVTRHGYYIPKECLHFAPKCPVNTVLVNDLCYRVVSVPMIWEDAKKDCESQGGFLAKPDFTYKNLTIDLSPVYRKISSVAYVWIGAKDHSNSEAMWKWTDGSELDVNHPNWYTGHPGSNAENCAMLYRLTGKLLIRKDNCKNKRQFLCQFNPLY